MNFLGADKIWQIIILAVILVGLAVFDYAWITAVNEPVTIPLGEGDFFAQMNYRRIYVDHYGEQTVYHRIIAEKTRLQEEHEQVQDDWRNAQRLAKIWSAAVPLRRALQFEDKAKDQRSSLQERESQHAPLRAELEAAARKFASALMWRAQDHRKKGEDARGVERTARNQAREYRRQAVEAGKTQSQAETEAKGLEQRGNVGRVEQACQVEPFPQARIGNLLLDLPA